MALLIAYPLKTYYQWFIILLSLVSSNLSAQGQNFSRLSHRKSGVVFKNQLREDDKNNILRYEYFYNGGGVAIGDLDNDGLEDIFLTGNMTSNKVYRNLGDWKFEDKTKSAGVAGKDVWTTGVSMADVNADGLLDIYVCYSGKGDPKERSNELWINKGDFTFENMAVEYGLDDPSNSNQGLFFDYDRDGDLDMYLLNHHIQVITELELNEVKQVRHPYAGDKLYRNDAGKFTDVSVEAGILGSALGFGLGVVASDVNEDGWPDLLVTNDYIEPDYLYINNGDGTFTDRMKEYFRHISYFSMGADISDINNDGHPDVYTLDMLPEDNERQKLLYGPENYEQNALMIKQGFHHQYMRNMLQLNRGNGLFSEIGQLSNISNTDWSWSALFFDATNNGQKDLFITNGYYRDYTNRDFLKYKGDYYFKQAVANEKADTLHLVTSMTSTPVHNYMFENLGNLAFEDRSLEWGFGEKGFSSGAAYGDLDNDGDLDLVVNNLNEQASIYQNNNPKKNWIQLTLKDNTQNTYSIGAKVEVRTDTTKQFFEAQPVRGFQSSVSPRLHIGLDEVKIIPSIQINWPDGTVQVLEDIPANQHLTVHKEGKPANPASPKDTPLLVENKTVPNYQPEKDSYNDFKRQPLMLTMPSYISPVLAQGDLNNDGIPEVFIGGSKGQAGKIVSLIGDKWVTYQGFKSSNEFTDAVALFIDFNSDGFQDLFIGSGGYHDYLGSDESLRDRLYINDAKGNLGRQISFPDYKFSTGTAEALDVNADGHLDLFVGARMIPGKYPIIVPSKVLINDGKGKFTDQSEQFLPSEGKLGLLTSSESIDLNVDGRTDLILAGEYMPITVLINSGSGFEDQTSSYMKSPLAGWWNVLQKTDIDNDGDLDLIAGNFGLNSQFEADTETGKKLRLYAADFDQNGSIDPILECFVGDKMYPYPSRDELLDQMVSMRSRFTDYASYSKATMEDLFTPKELESAQLLEANQLESLALVNKGGSFEVKKLPGIAQSFPIYSILPIDLNKDGHMDLIAGGNQSNARIRIGLLNAGLGLAMLGDGTGKFTPLSPSESGLAIKGDIKSILPVQTNLGTQLLFGVNQKPIVSYQVQ